MGRQANGPGVSTDETHLVDVMCAYQAGHLEAFEALYAALAPDLRRYFASSILDRPFADDLAQQTFLEIHRARRTYTPPAPVRPWIFGIARNVRRRHRRDSVHRTRYEDDGAGDALGRTPSATRDAVADIAVRDALQQVPARRRRAWILHHVHGLSFEEIAGRLGGGAGAAKLRSSRAMRTLRALLGARRRSDDA